ncbi:16S rRNA (cytosine(1402)-N(4))-methyltransferase [Lacrimispora algidixylanolytica]|uniref:16S rRNA (Cytosine(1402)-N(4))-methyltransferase n=1 Tax=Lacrimispora algidixylanolytica TaxID=94868 RepID=A0A419T355_9FIRM|nr:16S rRNA (cytosine(1402)-N(4))-methyltransferase [Lacrimispora algidixylanolytica]
MKQTNFSNIDQITSESRPLDLRLNPSKGISAAERLKSISQDELHGMLLENADEPHSEEIARAIISAIKKGTDIITTSLLQQIIKDTLKFIPEKDRDNEIKKSCQRCFQALRIDVNKEFEVLYEFLDFRYVQIHIVFHPHHHRINRQ